MRVNSLPPYLYKAMPNLCQTDSRSETLREKGLVYCIPVSVSNILIHLAKRHFRFIVEGLGKLNETEAQLKLVEKLGDLMKTSKNGTEYADMEEGLRKYLSERGYKVRFVSEIYDKQESFTPQTIRSASTIAPYVIGTSNALVYVTFAKFIPEFKKYELIEQHGMTLAGFVNNGTNCELIIHDPSPGTERKPSRCQLFPIQDGIFHQWNGMPSLNANGFNELEGVGIDTPEKIRGANKIVLYGVQSFEVYRE